MVFALFLLSFFSFSLFLPFFTFFLFLLISLFILFLFCFCFRPKKPELNETPNLAPHFRWTLPLDLPSGESPSTGQPSTGQPSAGPPKISLFFFSLLPPQFSFFFLSLGVFSWNFLGVFEDRNPEMCTFGLSGCRVKPWRPHQTGPPGLAHDSPRTPNVHISGPRRFKHNQNSTKGPQERERRKKIVAEEGKKREILGPPPFWAPPFGAPPFGAPLFPGLGLHPLGLHPSRAPHFVVPKFNIQKLAEVEIGRSRNWPKSKLAEVEIGRSRNWPKSNWPNSKKAGRSRNWPKSIAL